MSAPHAGRASAVPSGPTFYEVGSILFGRALRLFVGHWILSLNGAQFFVTELVHACGPSHGANGRKPLNDFVDLGMVAEVPSYVPGQRRKYYRQIESPLWDAVRAAVRASGHDPSQPPSLTSLNRPLTPASAAARRPR
jgi:hypothetical protein